MKKLPRIRNAKHEPIKPEKRKPGRPEGSKNKALVSHVNLVSRVKSGLLHGWTQTKAPAIILSMLNMQLPPIYRNVYGEGKKLTDVQLLGINKLLLANFKWANEFVARNCIPKDQVHRGSIKHAHTLTGLTRRAIEGKKSPKILELVKKQTEKGITEYHAPEMDRKGKIVYGFENDNQNMDMSEEENEAADGHS